jgi:hypothetical protein
MCSGSVGISWSTNDTRRVVVLLLLQVRSLMSKEHSNQAKDLVNQK